jgi:hypothetical protein
MSSAKKTKAAKSTSQVVDDDDLGIDAESELSEHSDDEKQDLEDDYVSDYEEKAEPQSDVKKPPVDSDDEGPVAEVAAEPAEAEVEEKVVPKVKKLFATGAVAPSGDSDDEGEDAIVEWDDAEGADAGEPTDRKTYTFVPDDERRSSERLSLPECARLLGDRVRHIDNGAPVYIDITNMTSSQEIAYNELLQKRIPMGILRHIGLGYVERWYLREMILPRLPPVETFLNR